MKRKPDLAVGQKEVAEKLGTSQTKVSDAERRALEAMRRELESRGLDFSSIYWR